MMGGSVLGLITMFVALECDDNAHHRVCGSKRVEGRRKVISGRSKQGSEFVKRIESRIDCSFPFGFSIEYERISNERSIEHLQE
jgi:hypothetical protein